MKPTDKVIVHVHSAHKPNTCFWITPASDLTTDASMAGEFEVREVIAAVQKLIDKYPNEIYAWAEPMNDPALVPDSIKALFSATTSSRDES